MGLTFYSLSSGSSGNCYYIGNEFHGILVDAGISATSIRKALGNAGISMQSVQGIFITHNHIDHIKGLEVLTRKHSIPAFTTARIWKSILNPGKKISRDCIREIPLQQEFHIAGFDIVSFPVYHDAPETVGFHICYGNRKITIATDLGHICSNSEPYLRAANLLVIESNYDEEMLAHGLYPPYLKARISSDHGHLGNLQTASFLSDAINEELMHVCLAHLSKNNNTPAQVLLTLNRAFSEKGIPEESLPPVTVLHRDKPSEIIILE
jgi:phosphoribosyl 1,2-cyclic phosphodiesterase